MIERVQQIRPESETKPVDSSDVVVIGAGLAGKAASLQLARAGLKVICISPSQSTRPPVGESLDWSAPDLLRNLGLPMEHLIDCQMATWKRHVTLRMRDGCSEHYVPSTWLGKSPLNIELRTLHIDRVRLDDELLRFTVDAGVTLVADKAVGVERTGNRISAIRTANGQSFSADWFIDASGIGASLFGREFRLPKIEDGRTKVAIWTYFPVTDPVEGTTLYVDPSPTEYLGWVWEIPVNPQTVGVGVVTTGEAMKSRRDRGLTVDAIYREELAKFPTSSRCWSMAPSAQRM
jgi:menaquinone-9 beta-reductase